MTKVLLHELGKSVSFGRLSLLGKVLWPMLLAASDDQGRGQAEADVLKWTVCPNVPELTVENIGGLLQEMADQEMVCLYQDGRGRPLYQIVRWWEYQSPQWAQPSRYEAPEGWADRVRANRRGSEYVEENWGTGGGFNGNDYANPPGDAGESPPEDSAGNPPGNTPEPTRLTQSNLTQSNIIEHAPSATPPDPPPPRSKRKTPKPKTPVPPAVRVFRANAHRFPAKAWYGEVAGLVGEDEQELERWGKVVKAWVGCGWNPTNVKGMLEMFRRGEIPSTGGKGKGKSEPAGYDAIRSYAARHGAGGEPQ
jgi:hypothetical protein